MAYIVLYKFPPENGIKYFLEKNLSDSGLKERKIEYQIIQGHPLFNNTNNSESPDKFFPAIGVEWITDTRQDFIGQNFNEIYNNDRLKLDFQNYKTIPIHDRAISDNQLDILTNAKKLQRFIHKVESRVIIAGFTSGGTGRPTLRSIYEVVDGVLEGMTHDIMGLFQGVKVDIEKNNEVNISASQFGFPVWGFEIGLKITQPRITIRSIPYYPEEEIRCFDVYLEKSKTVFKEINSFFNFEEIKSS